MYITKLMVLKNPPINVYNQTNGTFLVRLNLIMMAYKVMLHGTIRNDDF